MISSPVDHYVSVARFQVIVMACMEFEMGKVSHSSVLVDVKVKERGVGGSGGRTSSKCAWVGAVVVELP